MQTIQDLRKWITPQQQDILSTIWQSYLDNNRWIPIRVLHSRHGGKGVARPDLEKLGGSIVLEVEETEDTVYRLTLLGVLLTEQGDHYQELLADYLHYTVSVFKRDPERKQVTSSEVADALNLTQENTSLLGKLLFQLYPSPFQHGGGYGSQEWHAIMPDNIEDLPSDLDQLGRYVAECALKDYDPSIPVPANERLQHYANRLAKQARPEPSEFEFIQDSAARQRLEQDWIEASTAYRAGIWKSCIILCGSVLEGMLLAVLGWVEDRRPGTLRQRIPDKKQNLARWRLVDLVEGAKALNAVGEGASYLGHALREYRNLVHPGVQASQLPVTEDEASIALGSVRRYMRELQEFVATEERTP